MYGGKETCIYCVGGEKIHFEDLGIDGRIIVPRSWKSRAIPLPTLSATPGL